MGRPRPVSDVPVPSWRSADLQRYGSSQDMYVSKGKDRKKQRLGHLVVRGHDVAEREYRAPYQERPRRSRRTHPLTSVEEMDVNHASPWRERRIPPNDLEITSSGDSMDRTLATVFSDRREISRSFSGEGERMRRIEPKRGIDSRERPVESTCCFDESFMKDMQELMPATLQCCGQNNEVDRDSEVSYMETLRDVLLLTAGIGGCGLALLLC